MAPKKWLTLANKYNLKHSGQPFWKQLLDGTQYGIGSTRVSIPAIEGVAGKDEGQFQESWVAAYDKNSRKWVLDPNEAPLHAWSIPNAEPHYNLTASKKVSGRNTQLVSNSFDKDWNPHGTVYQKQSFLNDSATKLYSMAAQNLGLKLDLSTKAGQGQATDLNKLIAIKPTVVSNELTPAAIEALTIDKPNTYASSLPGRPAFFDYFGTEPSTAGESETRPHFNKIMSRFTPSIVDYMFIKKGKAFDIKLNTTPASIPTNYSQINGNYDGQINVEFNTQIQNQLDNNLVYDMSNLSYSFGWLFYAESIDGKKIGVSLEIPDVFEYFFGSTKYFADNRSGKLNLNSLTTLSTVDNQTIRLDKEFLVNDKFNYEPKASLKANATSSEKYSYYVTNASSSKSLISSMFGSNINGDYNNWSNTTKRDASVQKYIDLLNAGEAFQKQGYLNAADGGFISAENVAVDPDEMLKLEVSRIAGTNNWSIRLKDSAGNYVPTRDVGAKPVLVARLKAIMSLHALSKKLTGFPFEGQGWGSFVPKANKAYANPVVSRQFNRKRQFVDVILDRIVDLDQSFFIDLLTKGIQRGTASANLSQQADELLKNQYKTSTPLYLKAIYEQDKAKYTGKLNPLLAIDASKQSTIQKNQISILNDILKQINIELLGLGISKTAVDAIQKSISSKSVSLAQVNSLKTMLENLKKRYAAYKTKLTKLDADLMSSTISIDFNRLRTATSSPAIAFMPKLIMDVSRIFPGASQQVPPEASEFVESVMPIITKFTGNQRVRADKLDGVILAQFASGLDSVVNEGLLTDAEAVAVMSYLLAADTPPAQSSSSQSMLFPTFNTTPASAAAFDSLKNLNAGDTSKPPVNQSPISSQAVTKAVTNAMSTNKLYNVKLFGYQQLGADAPASKTQYVKIKPAILASIKPKLKDSYRVDDALFQEMLTEALDAKGLQLKLTGADQQPIIEAVQTTDVGPGQPIIDIPADTVVFNEAEDTTQSKLPIYLGIGAVTVLGGAAYWFSKKHKK